MREHAVTGIILIFGLLVASLGFLGGYYAVQNFFAVPESVQTFVDEYRQGEFSQEMQGGGFADVLEKKEELSGRMAPAAVRLDIFYILKEKPEAVISVLDTSAGRWKLYTLPTDTHVALGETRYRRLSAQYPALPQMFEIGVLTEYMEQGQAAQVLAEVLSDMLFCSFSTAVTCTEEEFSDWCIKSGEIYVLTQETAEYLAENPISKRVAERLAQREDESALYYAETLARLSPQDFAAALIAGARENDGYRMDEALARQQLAGGGAQRTEGGST